MSNFKFYFSIVVIFNFFFLNVIADNNYYMIGIKSNLTDVDYDDASEEIQNRIDELTNDIMNNIYNIIVDNKKTYVLENGKIDKNLNEISEISQLKKRNLDENKKIKIEFINTNAFIYKNKSHKLNNSKRSLNTTTTKKNEENVEYIQFKSNLVSHLCSVGNYLVIQAYLSDSIVDKVKKLPNVEIVELSSVTKDYHSIKYNSKRSSDGSNTGNKNNYFDEEKILKETKWKGLGVQKNNFDFSLKHSHLSLISQGRFNISSNIPYDNNYYYPSSAGKGVDVFIIERGVNVSFNEDDFDTYEGTSDERIISCDGDIYDGEFHNVSNITECELNDDHGTFISIAAVGKINGVAKKANLHILKTAHGYNNDMLALKYIEQNAKPGKAVVNISRGCKGSKCNNSLIQEQINKMVEKGIMIFVAVGNEDEYVCGSDFYTSYEGVIPIGSVDNQYIDPPGEMEELYQFAYYSNHGECVDLLAPGTIRVIQYPSNEMIDFDSGTSFSSPLVAGVAATIISEFSDTKFNYKTMRQKLIDLSLKDAVAGVYSDTPNRLVNNGKLSLAQPPRCDDPSGRYHCHDGCCTKYGYCITYIPDDYPSDYLCLIESQCKPEFGYCNSDRCDNAYAKNKCTENECCTKFGDCVDINGDANSYCYIENGCISEFSGRCLSSDSNVKTKIVYIKNMNGNGCIYAHKTETYKLRYSSTCKEDPNYLWEIPESGSGLWRNVGTNYYITFNGNSLITTKQKSKAVNMGDMKKSKIANSMWYDHPDYKNSCSAESQGKINLEQCNKNNKSQRWVAMDKDSFKTTTTKAKAKTTTTTTTKTKAKTTTTTTTSSTSTSSQTYTAVKFKGTLPYDNTLYLSVPKLDLIDAYGMSSNDKYYSWFVTSTTNPSYLYLSDGISGKVGKPTNYCLDLSTRVNNGNEKYNYLRIVKCSEAKYKFKFNGSYKNGEINSISIYTSKNKAYSINNTNVCLYYSMTPRIINCNNTKKSEQISWKILDIKTYKN